MLKYSVEYNTNEVSKNQSYDDVSFQVVLELNQNGQGQLNQDSRKE